MIEVKVVEAHGTNLHLKHGNEKLKIRGADKKAATRAIVAYVTRHGKERIVERKGYSGALRGYARFKNREYTLKMPVSKLKELLYISSRNRNSPTVKRIQDFIKQVESE